MKCSSPPPANCKQPPHRALRHLRRLRRSLRRTKTSNTVRHDTVRAGPLPARIDLTSVPRQVQRSGAMSRTGQRIDQGSFRICHPHGLIARITATEKKARHTLPGLSLCCSCYLLFQDRWAISSISLVHDRRHRTCGFRMRHRYSSRSCRSYPRQGLPLTAC